MSSLPKKVIALLDVDHTLLFNKTLNTDLLTALKAKKIKDIYLFTDMLLDKHSIEDRLSLIASLKTLGFNVHGVITPSDLIWPYLDKKIVPALFNEFTNNYKGAYNDEAFTLFLDKLKETFPELVNLMTILEEQPYQMAEPGNAFNEACETDDIDLIYKASFLAKILAEQFPEFDYYGDPKAFMLQLFLIFQGPGIELVIADDKASVIEALEKVDTGIIKCTLVHVTKAMQAADYDQALQEVTKVKSRSLIRRMSSSMFHRNHHESHTVPGQDKEAEKKEEKKEEKNEIGPTVFFPSCEGGIKVTEEKKEGTTTITFTNYDS